VSFAYEQKGTTMDEERKAVVVVYQTNPGVDATRQVGRFELSVPMGVVRRQRSWREALRVRVAGEYSQEVLSINELHDSDADVVVTISARSAGIALAPARPAAAPRPVGKRTMAARQRAQRAGR